MSDFLENERPQSLSDIQGHNKTLKKLKKWANNWSPSSPNFLLAGDPGVGKTSVATALANDMDWPVIEINASSDRTKDSLEFMEREFYRRPPGGFHLILLDEIDGLGRGSGTSVLRRAINNTQNPVIATANDSYSLPYSLKSCFENIDMQLYASSKKARLRKVAKENDIDVTPKDINDLAQRNGLREAIVDLKSMGADSGGNTRTEFQGEFDMVENVLKGKPVDWSDISPEELLWWLDENWRADTSAVGKGTKDIRGREQVLAYNMLSQSDINLLRGRSNGQFRDYAKNMQSITGTLRSTEPWHPPGKEAWISVNYPEWFRQSSDGFGANSPEAKLHERMRDSGVFQGFQEFVDTTLPILKDLSEDEKRNLALEIQLSQGNEDEIEALDMEANEYLRWKANEK